MTHEEKASELFFKFRNLEDGDSWINNRNAKQCALICVEEMRLFLRFVNDSKYYPEQDQELQQVKQAIEKL